MSIGERDRRPTAGSRTRGSCRGIPRRAWPPLAVDSPAMAPCDVFTRILFALLAIAGLATGCRSTESAAPAASLIGTSWLAEEIDEQRVLERIESTLSFDSAQRITGQAACNRYFGALELGEGTIRLKPAGTTRMACAPAVMDQESRFFAALGAVSAFRRGAGKLVLLDETGRVRVRLTAHGPSRGATAPPPRGPSVVPAPSSRLTRSIVTTDLAS